MRVLFTTVGLSGHFFPLVPLAWACRAAGHEVLVATAAAFVPSVVRTGLPAASYGAVAGFVDLVAELPAGTAEPRPHRHGRAFGRIAAGGVEGLRSLVAAWRPDLIVSERAEFAGPLAATVAEIPFVQYHWGVAALEDYRVAAGRELEPALAAAGLAGLPTPAEVVDPWPRALRQVHALGHQSVRHVPYNGDARVPAWALRPAEGTRVCLTHGTLVPRLRSAGPDLLLSMVQHLARLDVELVVAVDDDVVAGWPPLPAVVRAAGRLPLAQVLAVSDVAITHGGQGSVLTALAAGCPQLALPQFDDQFDNAAAVVAAGAGLSLSPDEAMPETVADRCRELMRGARFRLAARGLAADLAAEPSPAEVVGLLEKLVT